MKYFYSISSFQTFTVEQASDVLPKNFSVIQEDNQMILEIEIEDSLSQEQVFYQVQRECDRLSFLTGEQFSPELLRIQGQDGSKTGFGKITLDATIVKPLDPKIDRQDWKTTPLAVQLRLWQLARSASLPLAAGINLLFQIIEVAYPKNSYPEYNDVNIHPDPRTEAKLLRDLASHGKQQMGNLQVQKYCQYLGISSESHDPTNTEFLQTLNKRYQIILDEARKAIETNITKSV